MGANVVEGVKVTQTQTDRSRARWVELRIMDARVDLFVSAKAVEQGWTFDYSR